MSFTEAVKSVFSKYATFSGRARRSEYWYYALFLFLVSFVLSLIAAFVPSLKSAMQIINGLFGLAVLIPSLAVTWRRLHDIGKSGGFFFLGLIPLIGEIILLVWTLKDSQPGTNAYGECPKA